MPLDPGTRLGSYEIVSVLGIGGMGEVYRARDLRLQRDVALKALPDVAASDPERRERFRREALAVASLNHPHIVTIHSVEDAGSTVFLTMELVNGRSLADALPAGGFPLERMLAIGIPVTEAVSAAHQKGITHRDLKPANIMLGEGDQAGRIKVLDFGLAKALHGDADVFGAGLAAALADSPTFTSLPKTRQGVILGTAAYMSPEQAEGRPVDARTDLFSLGVILYEMATGQRPFTGDTSMSIVSSVLKDTPKLVTEINPALPAELNRIIRRALAKDPERRYQDARDLRNDLEELKAALDSGELVSRPAAGRPMRRDVLSRIKSARTFAAGAIALAIAAVSFGTFSRQSPSESNSDAAAPFSLADLQVTQLTTTGNAERPAISPDERFVAYVQHEGDEFSLWIRQIASTSHVKLVPSAPGVQLLGATFTPDGASVDYVRQAAGATPEVWRVPFLGGPPRMVVSNVSSPISWAPDGRSFAFLRTRVVPTLSSDLIVAEADGGRERTLASSATPEPWISLVAPWRPSFAPAWSPDGKRIAVAAAVIIGGGRVIFVNIETGATHGLSVANGGISGLEWLDSQSLVVDYPAQLGSPNQLFRLQYPAGTLARLTNDPNDYVGVSVSASRAGLVTSRRDARMDVWLGDGEVSNGIVVVRRAPISIERLAWSGEHLLYGSVVGGRPAILRLTPGQSAPEELLLDAVAPGVTSDGRTVVFVTSSTDNILDLWKADGSGRRITKLASSVTASQVVVTPDDRSVIYSSIASGTVSIWTVPLEGGDPTKLADGAGASVSPDGASLAFTDSQAQLRVCRLPGCTAQHTIGSAPLDAPVAWAPDGCGVAYAIEGNVWVQPLGGGSPRQLTPSTDNRPIGSFAWSRDGKRLAITRSTVTNDIVSVQGLTR